MVAAPNPLDDRRLEWANGESAAQSTSQPRGDAGATALTSECVREIHRTQHSARTGHQYFQDGRLGGGKMNNVSIEEDTPPGPVENDRPDGQRHERIFALHHCHSRRQVALNKESGRVQDLAQVGRKPNHKLRAGFT